MAAVSVFEDVPAILEGSDALDKAGFQ